MLYELRVRSTLNDTPLVHHRDDVGVLAINESDQSYLSNSSINQMSLVG